MEEIMHFSLINHGVLQAVPGSDIEIRIDKTKSHVVMIKEIKGQGNYAVMDWVSSIMQKLVEEKKIDMNHSEARVEASTQADYSGTFAMERAEWGEFVHYTPIIKTWKKTNAENSREQRTQAQI